MLAAFVYELVTERSTCRVVRELLAVGCEGEGKPLGDMILTLATNNKAHSLSPLGYSKAGSRTNIKLF